MAETERSWSRGIFVGRRKKELVGEFAGRYVAFIGSLTVKTKMENAKRVEKIVVHSNMRLKEPW